MDYKLVKLALGIGILIILSVGLYYYYSKNASINKYRAMTREAEQFHHFPGKLNETIEKFSIAASIAPDKTSRSRVVSKLGYDLFSRNAGTDRIDAIRLFKEIIADPKLSPIRHAVAMSELAFNLYRIGGKEREDLAPLVFNNEPYITYLSKAGGDASRAVRRIFEESDKLYPNAEAKSMVALMYADRLREEPEPGLTRGEIARIIQQYVNNALSLFEDKDSGVVYENGRLAFLYSASARALDWSDQVLRNTPAKEIENIYIKAVQTADLESDDDVHSEITGVYARYYYAIFLVSRFGDSRRDNIAPLLDRIASINGLQFDSFKRYITSVFGRPKTNYTKTQVLKLAGMSEKFRIFLRNNGWEI